MKHTTLLGIAALLLAPFAESHSAPAPAQDAGWQSAGSIFVLTTPEGADLPASAVVDGFGLLVRLHRHRLMKRIQTRPAVPQAVERSDEFAGELWC